MCLSADRALECAVEKEEEMMTSCDVCTTSSNIGKKQNGRQYNVCIDTFNCVSYSYCL